MTSARNLRACAYLGPTITASVAGSPGGSAVADPATPVRPARRHLTPPSRTGALGDVGPPVAERHRVRRAAAALSRRLSLPGGCSAGWLALPSSSTSDPVPPVEGVAEDELPGCLARPGPAGPRSAGHAPALRLVRIGTPAESATPRRHRRSACWISAAPACSARADPTSRLIRKGVVSRRWQARASSEMHVIEAVRRPGARSSTVSSVSRPRRKPPRPPNADDPRRTGGWQAP